VVVGGGEAVGTSSDGVFVIPQETIKRELRSINRKNETREIDFLKG
jgi:hypothetical protein